MSKAKLYKINRVEKNNNYNKKNETGSFIVGIIVYAFVLLLASNLFENFFITDFIHAIIAALILSLLNSIIKPALIFLTLPLTIATLGIAYPIVNMIILKLCDVFMGTHFEIHGFISMFFIAIFISALKLILDGLITKRLGGN